MSKDPNVFDSLGAVLAQSHPLSQEEAEAVAEALEGEAAVYFSDEHSEK